MRAQPFFKGVIDPLLVSPDGATRDRWFDAAAQANAGVVRLNLPWRSVVSGRPAEPTNPADPAYNFSTWDAAVKEAAARGQRTMLTIYDAPDFAEAKNQPEKPDGLHPEGTFRPDPRAFGDFGEAVATRYSGTFSSGLLATLPEVTYFEAWNEPNISLHLNPQWGGRGRLENKSAVNYRRLLNGFYAGVKQANPDAKVVSAGLAPFGDDPPNEIRTRPLRFMRIFLCLKDNPNLRPDKCKSPPKFDIFAHHPINIYGGPRKSGQNPDDVSAANDVQHVARTLRFAERKNTVKGRHGLWATEFWWETDPPDRRHGWTLSQQAQWIEECLYLLWKHGATGAIQFLLVDDPLDDEGGGLQSGLYFADGSPKPSLQAFRFPFVADRDSKKKLIVWTIPPSSGELRVEQKRGSTWEIVASGNATAGQVLTDKLSLKGKTTLRASVGGEQSLSWSEGGNGTKGYGRVTRSDSDSPPSAEPPLLELPDPAGAVPDSLAPYVESIPAP